MPCGERLTLRTKVCGGTEPMQRKADLSLFRGIKREGGKKEGSPTEEDVRKNRGKGFCGRTVMRRDAVRDVIVIGGGAAGLLAACEAGRRGLDVLLLEKNAKPGKKLSQTGNGKCNYTNLEMDSSRYRGENPAFIEAVLSCFSAEDALSYFREFGIEPRYRGSYVYPRSEEAQAFTEALCRKLKRCSVEIKLNCRAERLHRMGDAGKGSGDTVGGEKERGKRKDRGNPEEQRGLRGDREPAAPESARFLVESSAGAFYTRNLILASGSRAMPQSGSEGDSYVFLKKLKLPMVPVVPALTGVRAKERICRYWAGVRTEGKISVWSENQLLSEDTGELQLTDYGVSGIPVFQVSRYISYQLLKTPEVRVELDFLPGESEEESRTAFRKRKEHLKEERQKDFLLSFFHRRLSEVVLRDCRLFSEKPVGVLTEEELERLVQRLRHYPLHITAANDFTRAQCCAGGLDTRAVSAETMEIQGIPGLYAVGELLDVDGICGGYNLHFAFGCGILAGRAVR